MSDLVPNTYVSLSSGPLPVEKDEFWLIPTPCEENPAPGDVFIKVGDIVTQTVKDQPTKVFISVGKPEKTIANSYRKAGCWTAKWLLRHYVVRAAIDAAHFKSAIPGAFQAFCEGLMIGSFRFLRHKTPEIKHKAIEVTLRCEKDELIELARLANHVSTTVQAVNLARDWAQEPANVINPITLAERAVNLASQYGLTCKVLDDRQLVEMGAGAITSVGKGSNSPARMIIMEYHGAGEGVGQPPVALVGKAITFDTGGYSIKSVDAIKTMKFDKSGGAVVLAVLKAAAEMKFTTPLVGVVCAAENMISGGAYRPDDIITSLSGKTIEIVSTDAEGRLVLADGLTYVQRQYSPRCVIDIATLTGGIATALGRFRAGLFSNNDDLANQLFDAGTVTHELLWHMPIDDEYFINMKGIDADIRNSGGKYGTPVYGALFLKQFIESGTPWAHIDIAGVADNTIEDYYIPVGATGFGVRLLLHYLETIG